MTEAKDKKKGSSQSKLKDAAKRLHEYILQKQNDDFDNEIEKATRGIVKTPFNSTTENAEEVSHTTAVEGPAWRSEE